MTAKRILFVHQNFPGQFPHIAQAAMARGHKLAAIGGPTAKGQPGIDVRRWKYGRGSTPDIFDQATRAEADLIRAFAAAEVAAGLKADGFIPDLIVGHPGWGETLQLNEVFPGVPQILFAEYYYRSHGADVGFDPEFEQMTLEKSMRVNAKNIGLSMAYGQADVIVVPTPFQASAFPPAFRHHMRVVHEGVDISRAMRKANPRLKMPNGKILDGSTPVITFINRNFERLRGFHIFMRALPAFMERRPDAHVILIGSDSPGGYGGKLEGGRTWRSTMLDEVGDRLDPARIHFTGPVSHGDMISALSMSWGHVYYTYPFVLSWSLVEAMACECLILGSDTAPVRDAIAPGVNGLLNDFFDVDALTEAMVLACEAPERFTDLRKAARVTAREKYDRESVGVPAWMALIEEILARPRPA